MSDKVYHAPLGDPCQKCGVNKLRHRVEHIYMGEKDTCIKCGLLPHQHRDRDRPEHDNRKKESIYCGIDGEGIGREDHRYVYLAIRSEDETFTASAEDFDRGLSTKRCLDLILESGSNRKKLCAYSFNYDLTKILTDCDNKTLYYLFRPELRKRYGDKAKFGPWPVPWNGYFLNLQGTKFVVKKDGIRVIVWDFFKFFQGKFTNALKDWKVGEHELVKRMEYMKDKRSEFDKLDREAIKKYCLEECQCMAALAHKLIDAHTACGLNLTSYYGAGSSGKAMLTVMGIKDQLSPVPNNMKDAVASSFFGGRFENARIGLVSDTVYNYDISSAYPYQTCFLPCLRHMKWKHVKKRIEIEGAQAALIQYSLNDSRITRPWGPFPFRDRDGSICYPISSGGGWIWDQEYRQAERLYSNVGFISAWVGHSDCQCQPFVKIPHYYRERIRIGKEGPGIVLKLGLNSCYGKLAQSIGSATFNNWIWASLITSGCRAQALELFGLHRDWDNILMVATDGVKSLELLTTPIPRDTDTFQTGKPLGGWEMEIEPQGVFLARPGIYFPINPTDQQIKKIRGRGVGKSVVFENWKSIIDHWNRHGLDQVATLANVSRFCGAKSSISRSGPPIKVGARGRLLDKGIYKRAHGGDGKPSYGQWITREVQLSFDPMPKRNGVTKGGRLGIRKMPQTQISQAYKKALIDPEGLTMEMLREEAIEQPDGGLVDYE
jgi:DNA polymerase type B, organellar and viral